jgi:hypothetical protein
VKKEWRFYPVIAPKGKVDFGRLPRSMSSVNWFQTQCRRSLSSGVSTFPGAARLGLRRLDAALWFFHLIL